MNNHENSCICCGRTSNLHKYAYKNPENRIVGWAFICNKHEDIAAGMNLRLYDKVKDEEIMIKLKRETWYYLYTDGVDLFISDDSPIRDKKGWQHPELPLKITGQVFHIPELKTSEDVIKFEDI